jgi:hypothetical protein
MLSTPIAISLLIGIVMTLKWMVERAFPSVPCPVKVK